jgi:hypothetical protein
VGAVAAQPGTALKEGIVIEFVSIAWPGLLALAGLLAFIARGIHNEHTRLHGRYRRQP